ncbi:hypothetical protein TNIN_352461 [Trichonephila inaurata madagascariensis]|uniref:Uncharacterized protein n=1 Tax=Trichonephila inaurata madagascariensis TaxID=2747483 RepID=A0A8X6XSU5_9ARAC|nr:hypothetical protein TNIN_352461 [Trichonephila inaurata madagascariensis]
MIRSEETNIRNTLRNFTFRTTPAEGKSLGKHGEGQGLHLNAREYEDSPKRANQKGKWVYLLLCLNNVLVKRKNTVVVRPQTVVSENKRVLE